MNRKMNWFQVFLRNISHPWKEVSWGLRTVLKGVFSPLQLIAVAIICIISFFAVLYGANIDPEFWRNKELTFFMLLFTCLFIAYNCLKAIWENIRLAIRQAQDQE